MSVQPETIDVTGEVSNFDDLAVQTFHGALLINTSADSGSNLPQDHETNSPFGLVIDEVLQGRLMRNQVAELVELHLDSFELAIVASYDSNIVPNYVSGECEIQKEATTGQGSVRNRIAAGDADYQHDGQEWDIADLDERGSYTELGPTGHRLMWTSAVATGAFNDGATGEGGGASTFNHPGKHVNFRQQYGGRGPVFENTDSLGSHHSLRWEANPGGQIWIRVRFRAYWDVFEFDRGEMRDISHDEII